MALLTAALLTVLAVLTAGTPPASAVEPASVTAWGERGSDSLDVPPSFDVDGIMAIAAGGYHNVALTPAGKVVTWGHMYGPGTITVPASLAGRTVTAVAADSNHSLALSSNGEVVGWGDNRDQQTVVPASLTGRRVTAIATGGWHNPALTSDGEIVEWGHMNFGDSSPPASLAGKRVTATAAATPTAWRGSPTAGSRPGGTVPGASSRSRPSLAGKTVTAIVASVFHSLALTSDGQVVAWGADTFGESDVPASLTGRDVVAIAAGQRHNLALTRRVPLAVVTSPQSTRVQPGTPVSFSATAAGDPPPTVQWQRTDYDGTCYDLSGATSPTYTFTPDAHGDGMLLRAVFTTTGRVFTSAATLTVNRAPRATTLVVAAAAATATPVTLTGTDPDNDPLTYAVVTPPAHGTLTGTSPHLTYTPATGTADPTPPPAGPTTAPSAPPPPP